MKKHLLLLSLFALLITACGQEQKQVDSQEQTEGSDVKPAPCRVGTDTYTEAPADNLTKATLLTEADFPEKVIIPVVFHVFGEDQKSGKINLARIEKVIKWINNDFHGEKNIGDTRWHGNVMAEFDDVKATFPEIEFRLAQFDPDGYPHTGLCMHTAKEGKGGGNGRGLGDSPKGDQYAKKYAWDNKMYMNVFITAGIYGVVPSGDSGVAWPPSMSMTNAGTARVVYNGNFLPGGIYSNKDFTSIISHEFGHFFNLRHTFEGGCVVGRDPSLGDGCPDTPQADNSDLGRNSLNCEGVLANYDNYMNYGEYGNWTKDQITRMKLAILNEPSRNCLWTAENLKNTLGIGGTPTPKPPKDPATLTEKLDYINKKAK